MVRFDKPCRRASAAVNYFRDHLRVGDYLSEKGRVDMTWFGEGAARLNLQGHCELTALERLCVGQHPATGLRLGVRDKGVNRRVCFFGQISAPKDVSIALHVGGDERINTWWREAVQETLHEIEGVTATRVRRGGANEDRTTSSMVAAVVTHDTSRALDPQLHTHVCVLNLTFDPVEQRWKGVQPFGYMRHQGFFREVCYNRLAYRMTEAGYDLEPQRGIGFTIRGFPERLRTEFSERRNKILSLAKERGVTSQDGLQAITLESRPAKRHTTASELRQAWLTRAGEDLLTIREVIAATYRRSVQRNPLTPQEALESAEAHVFERKSVVGTRDLLREALVLGRGDVTLDEVRAIMDDRVRREFLWQHEDEVASRDGLQAEQEFLSWANAGRDVCPSLGQNFEDTTLSSEQQEVVDGLLDSRSRVVVLAGDAGTGKTTCLKAVIQGIEQSGGQVFGCAPSSGATEVLRRELTPSADTLQQLLINTSLQRSTRGRVLIVDEAGLMSVRQMRDLSRMAAANQNRVILVGDTKQHTSVEAGDALRCLQKFTQVPIHRLTQIRRQRSPSYREAVAMLAKGEAFAAFNRFSQLGSVKEEPDVEELFRQAATDYVGRIKRQESCLAISPVWSEIHAFTGEVRGQLRTAGLLESKERNFETVFSLQWTKSQMRDLRNYQPGQVLQYYRSSGDFAKGQRLTVVGRDEQVLTVQFEDGGRMWFSPRHCPGFDVGIIQDVAVAVGDRLLIRANSKEAQLRNGDLVEVAGFEENGGLELSDGRRIPPSFREFSHGYATTSHAAQGKTVDHGILLMGDEGMVAANLKQAYVSNSRFRESQTIYTTDRREAREAMMSSGDRKLVHEMDDAVSPIIPLRGIRAKAQEKVVVGGTE